MHSDGPWERGAQDALPRWRFGLPFVLLILFAVAGTSVADDDAVDDSIERALSFLKRMQAPDGSWQDASQSNTAVSGLVLLAYLAAGHVPGEGPYAETVGKGIAWLLKQQAADGMFGPDMYHLGICTLALAEAAGMTDAKQGAEMRTKLEKSVALILRAQNLRNPIHKGGWRYSVDSYDADMSVTGWQIMALRAAKNLGCNVPAERIDLAMGFVKRCRESRSGAYCYQPQSSESVACTGTAVVSLVLGGKDTLTPYPSPPTGEGQGVRGEVLRAGSYVLHNSPNWGAQYFFYELYYSSQAMFQLGANYWGTYRPKMHRVLFDNQQRNGAWLDRDGIGPNYATAMGVLALAVEYRLLPIYQRGEDAEK